MKKRILYSSLAFANLFAMGYLVQHLHNWYVFPFYITSLVILFWLTIKILDTTLSK